MQRSVRASRACVWCQQRKVKCDASISGTPCTQCKQQRAICRFRSKCRTRQPASWMSFRESSTLTGPTASTIEGETPWLSLPLDKLPDLPEHSHFSTLPFLELKDRSTLDQVEPTTPEANGCLSIPSRPLLDDFVKQYFLYVHPSAPLIDEAVFWKAYSSDEKSDACKMPLVLFQAMLFASSPYVETSMLKNCGFPDKRTALCTLYNRAKLLFETKTEARPRYLAQVAVLLTFYTTAESPHAASFWLARAVKIAKLAESRSKHIKENGNKSEEQPTWKKRLWWSIIIRDRSLCLGLRREPQMTSRELMFVPTPIEDDEVMEEMCQSQVYDKTTKQVLTGVFREQCQLAVLLTAMVSLASAPNKISGSDVTNEELAVILSTISSTKEALADWMSFSRLQARLLGDPPAPVKRIIRITLMYYYAACIDVAHYEIMLLEKYSLFTGSLYTKRCLDIGNILHTSMAKLVEIMESFSQEEPFHGFPIALLAFLEMPLIISAIDLKLSPSVSEMEIRRRRMEAMGRLHSTCGQAYEIADSMGSNTNQLLRLAYDFTRRLFLQRDTGQIGSTELENQCVIKSRRTSSWGDAFLRFPRAYLMISTSVDYYLSVGKLPSPDCLPKFIRNTLPLGLTMVFEIELPWSPDCIGQRLGQSHQQRSLETSYPTSTGLTMVRGRDIRYHAGELLQYGQATTHGYASETATTISRKKGQKANNTNLDYFEMDTASDTEQDLDGKHGEDDLPLISPSICSANPPLSLDERALWSVLEVIGP